MATLVATSPPPISMHMDMDMGRSMFAQGHAPSSSAYSPPLPALPKLTEDTTTDTTTVSLPTLTPSLASIPAAAQALVPAAASMPSLIQHDAPTPLRPAKDLATFMSLLPQAVEFVEGSSSGAFAVAEGKYEPINASPKAVTAKSLANGNLNGIGSVSRNGESEPRSRSQASSNKKLFDEQDIQKSLYTRPVDLTWPSGFSHGSGLLNLGNTCFLNSAMQCLLHTPPLLRVLTSHSKDDQCRVKNAFCMTCATRQVMMDSYSKGRPFSPSPITKKLNVIAKHLRRGRQEDAHEFLRYAIDSLQKSCLAGHPPKLDHKVAETTWVHKIFGGRLRSRVTCSQCEHNSDTYDSILDLSIDIYNITDLKDALKKFTAIDQLKGADKYKCEKCKRPVNAEKRFTIDQAPTVLTVHLKRFTPLGRKLQHPIRYDDRLNLQPSMSEGEYGPIYTLYGVISHAGNGPNSGHYFAHVRGADGTWYEMNDDSVERRASATNMKNAYVLFYIREKGQALEAALKSTSVSRGMMRKRKDVPSGEEDSGNESKKTTRSFIGPVVPTHFQTPAVLKKGHVMLKTDLQPDKLRRKIEAVEAKKRQEAKPLVDYADDSEEEQGERVERYDLSLAKNDSGAALSSSPSPRAPLSNGQKNLIGDDQVGDEGVSSPARPPPTSPLLDTPISSPATAIPTSNFYGSTLSSSDVDSKRKRKAAGGDDEPDMEAMPRRNSYAGPGLNGFNTNKNTGVKGRLSLGAGSPFNRGRFGNNLDSVRDDKRERDYLHLQAARGRPSKTYASARRRIMM